MFSITVFYDERIVIVAEQRPDASEEDSFQWMSRVLQVRPLPSSQTTYSHPHSRKFRPLSIVLVHPHLYRSSEADLPEV